MGKRGGFLFIVFIFSLFFLPFIRNDRPPPKPIEDRLSYCINEYFVDAGKRLNRLSLQIEAQQNRGAFLPSNSRNTGRYRSFDEQVYYNPGSKNACAFWYSGPLKGEMAKKRLVYFERFEKYIKDAAVNGKDKNHIFLISVENIILSYPYVNFRVYLSPEADFKSLIIRNYNGYQTDKGWTIPYRDVMGSGYVTSLNTFILKDQLPVYQLSIDISIPELYKKTIERTRIPMMILYLPDYIIAANKSCRELFHISGKEKKIYLKDEKLQLRGLNPDDYWPDKKLSPELLAVFRKIKTRKEICINYKNKPFKVTGSSIKTTGWLLLSFRER